MNPANPRSWLVSAAVVALGSIAPPAWAQITPDATLPNNSIVLPNGNVLTIEGGTEAGTNLFHSFQDFSIPTGGEAFFNNATNITRIFSRVTGGNISEIDGTLRANGAANLFLMNPSGIIFGENASLEIGGSLFATTAQSIIFNDGIEFRANPANATPLLTMNVPVGLQMGSTPGDITVRGNGHNQTYPQDRTIPFDRTNSTRGLEVASGQTLGLVGGNIFLDRGVLTAPSGRIELGAVGGNRNVGVNLNPTASGWHFGYEGITNFGNIELKERSLVDASGTGSGRIRLQGSRVELLDASTLLIQNLGTLSGGRIQVNATEALEIAGSSLGGVAISDIRSETLGNGNSANIAIDTQQLTLGDGAVVGARTFSSAAGGNIDVIARERIELSGFAPGNPTFSSFIATATVGMTGDAGNVSISTGQLRFSDGSGISSVSVGMGAGGDVTIRATESVELLGLNPLTFTASNLGVFAIGSGDAGRLTIDTARVTIANGAGISSSTLASGAAGDIAINASEFVEVNGQFPTDTVMLPSQISASSELTDPTIRQAFGLPPVPTGESGNLRINTPALRVLNGATVSVRNDGTSGNAGSLEIQANSVLLEDRGSLTAFARDGRGGDIVLETQTLNARNGGQINASTRSGEGGNIELQVPDLQLSNGSFISTEAGGTGSGGNVTLDTDTIALLENSSITANAFEGAGGNIQITTLGLFVTPNSQITASSELGVDGSVSINNPIIDPASGLVALDGDTLNPNTQIQDSCEIAARSRFAITGSGGLPEDPTQNFLGRTVWRDTRLGEIQSNLTPNPAQTTPEASTTPPTPLVEATGWRTNSRGQIELIVASGNLSQSPWQPHLECDSSPHNGRS